MHTVTTDVFGRDAGNSRASVFSGSSDSMKMYTKKIHQTLSTCQAKMNIMDADEVAQKYSMSELRPIAKKYGIATRCVKKADIVKALPPEAIAELEQSKK